MDAQKTKLRQTEPKRKGALDLVAKRQQLLLTKTNNMNIAQNRVVVMHYTLKDEKGETIDSSQGHEPLAYIQGIGNIIPGLEDALEGKSQGDKLEVTISPEDGYGERQENMVQKVSKKRKEKSEALFCGEGDSASAH